MAMTLLSRKHKAEPEKLPPPVPVPVPESEPWSVRYTALMDDGVTHIWTKTFNWTTTRDKHEAAGHALLSYKYGHYSQVINGKLYPPHRLREVTWEVL